MTNPPQPPASQQPPYTQLPAYNMGYAPPPAPPQKKGLRWWGWLLIIGGGVLVLCCGGGVVVTFLANAANGSTTTNHNGNTGSTNNPTSGATATSQGSAKVGDTITVDDVSCTLVSAKTVQGDEFVKPDSGNVFVLVTVKIVNNSSSEYDYNPFDFNAEWSTGNIIAEEFVTPDSVSSSHQLNVGTLAAGGSVQGQLLFQVPKGDHQAKLTWQATFLSDKTSNAWLLGL